MECRRRRLGSVSSGGLHFAPMPTTAELITSLDDARLAPYRSLKGKELARQGGRFIAESEFVVRRLLASDYPAESVVVAERKAAALAEAVPSHVPLYAVPDRLLNEVVGYKFHTGVMAVGRRLPSPPLAAVLPAAGRSVVAVCPDLNNFENLGSVIRTAAAFGVDALLLGERCCDPFYRMSVRVSMGTCFRLPIVRSEDLLRDLAELRQSHGYQLLATVLDDDAEPLPTLAVPERTAVLFGNEAVGLSPADVAACDRRVTLPMRRGTDSLNVATAAAVFLYHLCGR
jgi:tRNA G18 (ribose-2'-O)-methylase SpoU